jgi:hypothetical protein
MSKQQTLEKYQGNTVEYWKQNAEENYLTTPISVLKYITVLEQQAKQLRKPKKETIDTSKVTRVEVIQYSPPHNGRAYTNYNAKDVSIQLQDENKTLKIFLK